MLTIDSTLLQCLWPTSNLNHESYFSLLAKGALSIARILVNRATPTSEPVYHRFELNLLSATFVNPKKAAL
jgi:hypothetical protein